MTKPFVARGRAFLSVVTGLSLLASVDAAAAQETDWGMLLGGAGNEVGYSVATDFDGSVVVAGSFDGTMSLGSEQVSSAGNDDVFVAKFSGDGVFRWVRRLGGTSSEQPAAVAIDRETGDVIVTGNFTTSVTADDRVLRSAGSTDVFVARYSTSGVLQWTLALGGSAADVAAGVAVAPNGDSLVAGQFSGTFACGPTALTSAGGTDIFVANVASNGALRWCRRYGGSTTDAVDGIAVGGNGLLALTGAFGATTDLGGGSLLSAGLYDVFVAAYLTDNGDYLWARRIGGSGYDEGNAVAFDHVGAVVVSGYFGLFGGGVDFGGGGVAAQGGADAFVAKYDGSDGGYLWAGTFGGELDDYANAVSIEPSGDILVAGEFQGAVRFAGIAASYAGQFDAFVARFSSIGAPLWWRPYGDVVNDKAYGVTADVEGNYWVTGFSMFRIDLGRGALYSAGRSDAFLVKLAPAAVDTPTPTRTCTPTRVPPTATPTFPLPPPSASTPTPASTLTPAVRACTVDCNDDGAVTVDELVAGINIVLGQMALSACNGFDANDDGTVSINEVVAAVKSVLVGCP